jgi:hypothetical protein
VTGRENPSGNYTHALREMVGQVESQKLDALTEEMWELKASDPG